MLDSHKLISTQIENSIPQFIRMEYPYFVEFIRSYYEWMEKEGSPYHFIANTLNFSDVDRTSLELLDEFGKNFLNPLPNIIYDQNNINTLVKNIEQYYSARGSEKAFQFLFRIFNYKQDDVNDLEFYYPSYDMLRISDGKWVNEKSIKIIDPVADTYTWESGQVIGQTSGAKAIIDEVKTYTSTSGESIAELFLLEYDIINSPEKFTTGETIEVITKEEVSFTDVIESVFYNVTIVDAGKYYIDNQRVHVDNVGIGEDASVITNHISKGEIESLTIISGGTGYAVNDKITAYSEDYGTGGYGKVTAVDGSGGITEVYLSSGGNNYNRIPKININSDSGRDAIIFAESTNIGNVVSTEVRDFGINYDTGDTSVIFNTMMRIYNVDSEYDIGETIVGQIASATGVIEFWDRNSGVISVRLTSGSFQAGEEIIGNRWGCSAIIYDLSVATGTLEEGCLCNYHGRYINLDGHISSLKYIQDSYFYQMFSYMLKTTEDKDEWRDYVKNVHPAGTIGFSYRDAISTYMNESYGGYISPSIDTTEFYKFSWIPEPYHGGFIGDRGNTQIKQYSNIVIDDVVNINTTTLNKTGFTFGSEITITTV